MEEVTKHNKKGGVWVVLSNIGTQVGWSLGRSSRLGIRSCLLVCCSRSLPLTSSNSASQTWLMRVHGPCQGAGDGFGLSTVPLGACGSYAFHSTGDLDSPHRVFEFCLRVLYTS